VDKCISVHQQRLTGAVFLPLKYTSTPGLLTGLSGGFLSKLLRDIVMGKVKENEVARAIDIRNIVTSLGPAYIKLGQVLSTRPDLHPRDDIEERKNHQDNAPELPFDTIKQVE
jgi:aarF domain-containing kinase